LRSYTRRTPLSAQGHVSWSFCHVILSGEVKLRIIICWKRLVHGTKCHTKDTQISGARVQKIDFSGQHGAWEPYIPGLVMLQLRKKYNILGPMGNNKEKTRDGRGGEGGRRQ
jgi:hypothetical protein